MNSIGNRTTLYYIVAILLAFAVWAFVSMGWYVCGMKGLCLPGQGGVAEAHDGIVHNDTDAAFVETQAPVTIGYERSGAAGEIFVMLMIAFTLGALLGRTLATATNTEEASGSARESKTPVIHLPAAATRVAPLKPVPALQLQQKPKEMRPTPGPVHISEVTKYVSPPQATPPVNLPRHEPATPPKPNSWNTPPVRTGGPARNVLRRDADGHSQSSSTLNRPKIRFNTSWNKPQ